MKAYREEFGRVRRFLSDVALDLHLLALDANQADYWLDEGDAEQTLCALQRCKQRANEIRRLCGELVSAQLVIEPPRAEPPTG